MAIRANSEQKQTEEQNLLLFWVLKINLGVKSGFMIKPQQ